MCHLFPLLLYAIAHTWTNARTSIIESATFGDPGGFWNMQNARSTTNVDVRWRQTHTCTTLASQEPSGNSQFSKPSAKFPLLAQDTLDLQSGTRKVSIMSSCFPENDANNFVVGGEDSNVYVCTRHGRCVFL